MTYEEKLEQYVSAYREFLIHAAYCTPYTPMPSQICAIRANAARRRLYAAAKEYFGKPISGYESREVGGGSSHHPPWNEYRISIDLPIPERGWHRSIGH